MNRRDYLLREAALALDHGANPLVLEDMSPLEREGLASHIAAILFGYMALPREARDSVLRGYAKSLMEVLAR